MRHLDEQDLRAAILGYEILRDQVDRDMATIRAMMNDAEPKPKKKWSAAARRRQSLAVKAQWAARRKG